MAEYYYFLYNKHTFMVFTSAVKNTLQSHTQFH